MTSAAAMISGGTVMATAGNGGGEGAGTGARATIKDPVSRSSLVPTPDAGSVGGRSGTTRSHSSSPASCSSSPTLPLAGLMMHEQERIRSMRSSAGGGSNRRRVKDFNDGITCTLCSGYLVEATTVNDCLHTFCRSCIVKYLESNKYCPRCKSFNSKPITAANLRPDRTLRALVYKLVPGLHKSESQRMVHFYAEISSSNNVPFGDDQLKQEALSLLDDQNFFSPDEPISLSLEYHSDTLAEHSVAGGKLPVTYLQCPAAVTVHHLYKFILTKNGLAVGADHIRVEIIYEDEVLPHDFTLMDVAYCFAYKRIAPMRLFYRILIHSTAKPAPTASTYHRVEGQDKNSTTPTGSAAESGAGSSGAAAAGNTTTTTTTAATTTTATSAGAPSPTTTATTTGRTGQRPGERQAAKEGGRVVGAGARPGTASTSAAVRPREDDANNSPMGASSSSSSSSSGTQQKENTATAGSNGVNGHPTTTAGSTRTAGSTVASGNANRAAGKSATGGPPEKPLPAVPSGAAEEKKVAVKSNAATSSGLKMVLVSSTSSRSRSESTSTSAESKRSPPPLKALQQVVDNPVVSDAKKTGTTPSVDRPTAASAREGKPHAAEQQKPAKQQTSAGVAAVGKEKQSSTPATSELKCYVNLKKQTVVGGAIATPADNKRPSPAEIPRLKIELPRLKTKLSVPGERHHQSQGTSPPSSSSSSAATSPSSAASASGSTGTSSSSSSGKSPVWPMGKEEYAKTIGLKPVYAVACVPGDEGVGGKHADGSSSSHRKRKKGKHSREAGGSGKRRKLHAEISSQQDASLKMKVKLTEKPPKHERLRSSGNEEESPHQSPPQQKPATPAPVVAAAAAKSPPQEVVSSSSMPKVIDITKDDDDVKFVPEQGPVVATVKVPVRRSPPVEPAVVPVVAPAPAVKTAAPPPVSSVSVPPASVKDKLSEMRAIRHKPMVYIPNLDRSLSADASISSFIESVQAKVSQARPVATTTAASIVSASVPPTMLKPTPALIPTTAPSSMAGKSQPRTPILSPRTMQSYPPLAYPLTSSTTGSPAAVSGPGPIRSMAPPSAMKRSISTDGGSAMHGPKMARLEPPTLVAPSMQSSPGNANKQPIHAPMFNFAKGANRAKAAQQAAGGSHQAQPAAQQPQQDVPYRSPISSSYTKEMATKKPIPNLLLPPASISVTKMSDMVSSSSAGMAPVVDHRPALEIVCIPPTAPVADKLSLAPFTTPPPPVGHKPSTLGNGGGPKTTRPPPATIPLIKVKKPSADAGTVSSSSTSACPPGMTPLSSGIRMKTTAPRSESNPPPSSNILDLSGSRRLSDEVIILDHSPAKGAPVEAGKPTAYDRDRMAAAASCRRNSIPGLKLPHEMMGFPIAPPHSGQKTLAPLPKLTEISRNRNLAVRQPNASIRNIPNPSALAFRGAQSSVTAVTSSGMSFSATTASNGGLTGGSQRSNGNPGNAPVTAGTSQTFTTNSYKNASSTPLNNGAGRNVGLPSNHELARGANLNGSGADLKAPTANGGGGNTVSNNNNTKTANANTACLNSLSGGKKTIEKVAAVLKAAAATVDSTPRAGTGTASTLTTSSSTSTTSSSSSNSGNSVASASTTSATNGGEGRKKSSIDGKTSPPRAASSTTATTMSAAATTTNGGNRGGHGDSLVTGVSSSSMAATVTGTTNGSSRTSPAGIVNVI